LGSLIFTAVVVRVRDLTLGTHTVIASILIDAYPVQATNKVNLLALVHVYASSSCDIVLESFRTEAVKTTQSVYTATLTTNPRKFPALVHILYDESVGIWYKTYSSRAETKELLSSLLWALLARISPCLPGRTTAGSTIG